MVTLGWMHKAGWFSVTAGLETGDAPPLRKGFAPGSPITLVGMDSKPQLNGRTGWSLSLIPKNGRCMVLLEPLPR